MNRPSPVEVFQNTRTHAFPPSVTNGTKENPTLVSDFNHRRTTTRQLHGRDMEEQIKEKDPRNEDNGGSGIPSSVSQHEVKVAETNQHEDSFLLSTPLKNNEKSSIKAREEVPELPEKYGELLEFFDRMTSSVRLLGLRKRASTFQNISRQVQVLTGRQFLLMHLAQIKHIIPEAVQIDKILLHDAETKCMKPEMKIELLLDVVRDHDDEEHGFLALSNLFSSRLEGFYVAHPEVCDIPEAELPEPFNKRTIAVKEDSISNNFRALNEVDALSSTHLPPSFRRHFYAKTISSKIEMADTKSTVNSPCKGDGEIEGESRLPHPKFTGSTGDITPMKPLPGITSFHVQTPLQTTPLRSISPTISVLTCEDVSKTKKSINTKQNSVNAKKSLDFFSIDSEHSTLSRKKISVHLSDLVIIIHQIFKSVNFCPITKQELVQKIIMSNVEIDDHSEVETQMEHLEKLVPEWFCKKLFPSGDLMYKVKKISDVNSICEIVNAI